MTKKVYVVSSGSYSDYSIDAIFSTKEKADQYLATQKAVIKHSCLDQYNDVEEFRLDVPKRQWETTVVWMAKNGDLAGVEMQGDRQLGWGGFDRYGNLIWVVAGHNDKRAIKVVNEKRAQILALEIWGDERKVKKLVR